MTRPLLPLSCRRRGLLAAAAALLLGAGLTAPAAAQRVAPGTRVRVTTDGARTVGRVERSAPDSLVLALRDGGLLALPWSDVARIEHSPGRRGHPGRGAAIGAVAMTALTVGSIAFGGSENEMEDDLHDALLVLTLPVNAVVGAGLGALVGLAWRTERWETLPVGVGLSGGRRGGRLSVAIRF